MSEMKNRSNVYIHSNAGNLELFKQELQTDILLACIDVEYEHFHQYIILHFTFENDSTVLFIFSFLTRFCSAENCLEILRAYSQILIHH